MPTEPLTADISAVLSLRAAERNAQLRRDHPVPPGLSMDFWAVLTAQASVGDILALWCLTKGRAWGEAHLGQVRAMGAPRRCFQNAGERALADAELTYVEGYACTGKLALPVHHAWLLGPSGQVLDPTWPQGGSYCGLPIQTEALRSVVAETRNWGFFGMATPAWVVEEPWTWLRV